MLAVAVLCSIVAYAAPREPQWPTQGKVPLQANFGCQYIATPTIEVNDVLASATDLTDHLPSRCIGFEARVTYGDVVLAHGDNLATGSFQTRVGKLYASGATILWTAVGAGKRFVGKVCANSGTASITIDLAW